MEKNYTMEEILKVFYEQVFTKANTGLEQKEEEWKKTFSIQVYGFERNKHKFIYFQFLDYGENFSDFDKHILEICDGGYGVWECEYNITKKQIVYITHHGFAMIKPQNKFC